MDRSQLYLTLFLSFLLLGHAYTTELEDSSENLDEHQNDVREDKVPKKVDEGIKKILLGIILNGLPPTLPVLDPLELEGPLDLELPDMPGAMHVNKLELDGINVVGLSNFEANVLELNLLGLRILFDLNIHIKGNSNFVDLDLLVADILPLYGNGTLELALDLKLDGYIQAGTEGDPSYIIVKDVPLTISFGELTFKLSNILGYEGSKEADIFNNLMGTATPEILNLTNDALVASLVPSLVNTVNEFLRELKLTASDLLNCINGDPKCPIELPTL